ncbi:MAG: 5-(carboxyamino)imidazole ribonucleotide synthase [Chloroflexi bacterium AL-N10]|nr:5-(carboxyamino)imidazole ribonucleotide synthase [Chloroflexi bacterium AL-N10]NOK92755.1 5-(carboxyamino)imidazole ribonucleotide synthase [Chloroflexi bacterium AL-N15]
MVFNQVGIIGGGQLAWMMADAARKLDIKLIVQTPNNNDPAVSIADRVIFANIADAQATKDLADFAEVITFENEFIDLEKLEKLAQDGVIFYPSLASLSPLLDKYEQRCFFRDINLPVPEFSLLELQEDLSQDLKFPLVLKARRHGYDGYGTFIIKNKEELRKVWTRYNCPSMLLEEFVPFTCELATIAARNIQGEIICYPVVETIQKNQVCHRVYAPAEVSENIIEQVKNIAHTLLTQLNYVGVFGIELFLTADNQVLVNEIAPRTHNSGHYTLDACEISQFEMQLRAVTGLNLPSPNLKTKAAVMINLLGYENSYNDYQEKRNKIKAISNTYLHWYNKTESKVSRKLGHVTLLGETKKELIKKAEEIESIWLNS